MVTYTIVGKGDDGSDISGTLVVKPKHKILVGIDFPNTTAAIDFHLREYQGLNYHRIFANPGFPELNSGKMVRLPENVIRHFSWSDDFSYDALKRYLDQMREKIETENLKWRVMVTWKHEPMKKVDSATYKMVGPQIASICSEYDFIIGNGPILTRFWMDQSGGNPDDYWYDGATFFGNDCYNGQTHALRSPTEMFDSTIAYAAKRNVPFLIPEYGSEFITGDVSGELRSTWMNDCVDYLKKNDCLAVAWWCNGVCVIDDFTTEKTMWQTLLRSYA